jgi:hypothetical protein
MERLNLVSRRISQCFWESEWKPENVQNAIDIMQFVYNMCEAHGELYHHKNESRTMGLKFIVKDWPLNEKELFLETLGKKFKIEGFSYYNVGFQASSGKLEAHEHDYGYNFSFSPK